MARNAKDNVVSFFHFDRMNQLQPEPGDWSNFLHKFMEGKSEHSFFFTLKWPNIIRFFGCALIFYTVDTVVFGSWYDHVSGWWEKKKTYPKLHYMFYEDLIEVSFKSSNAFRTLLYTK